MRNIEQITDHEERACKRIIDWFRGGTFEQLVRGLAGRVQSVEDRGFALIASRYLANSTGVTLDQWGDLVGIDRPIGMDDDDYRVLIYAKIAANTSNGTIPDVYNIMSTLGATSIRVYDVYPAAIEVQFTASSVIADCGCIRRILEGEDENDGGATAPIEIGLTENKSESGIPFGFAGTIGAGGYGVGAMGATG